MQPPMPTEVFCGTLQTPDSVTEAKTLLYRSYIQQLGWKIDSDNPSNIVVSMSENGHGKLVDDYDLLST